MTREPPLKITSTMIQELQFQLSLKQFEGPQLRPRKKSMVLSLRHTHADETLKTLGELNVIVSYKYQSVKLPLIVVARNGPNLVGWNWLRHIQLDWQSIATIRTASPGLRSLLTEHEALFKDELGTIRPHKATLHVQPDAAPKFFQATANAICSQGCLALQNNHHTLVKKPYKLSLLL